MPERVLAESITWDRPTLSRFRTAYQTALRVAEDPTRSDEFTFDGHLFYVPFAKYLIAYLDSVLAPVVTTGKEKRNGQS